MGLAASQARLLSITSRMADNELRSQLINNAKMRLTADSARVSDEYIDALNRTQLMFTNFDTSGNEMQQGLTFNSLTAYSSYNTQYGISDNMGNILVSATDATNFEVANGDLNKFLASYGLEKTTDYFEQLKVSEEFHQVLTEPAYAAGELKGVGYYDSHAIWQPLTSDIEELQAMYEAELGPTGINHYGREEILNSVEYGDYLSLVDEYQRARDTYNNLRTRRMKEWLAGDYSLHVGGLLDDGTPWERDLTFRADVVPSGENHNFEWLYNNAIEFCNGNSDGRGSRFSHPVEGMGLSDFKENFVKFAADVGLVYEEGIVRYLKHEEFPEYYNLLLAPDDEEFPGAQPFIDALSMNLLMITAYEEGGTTFKSYYKETGPVAYFLKDENGQPTGSPIVAGQVSVEKADNENRAAHAGDQKIFIGGEGGFCYVTPDSNGDCYFYNEEFPEAGSYIPAYWDASTNTWKPADSAHPAQTGTIIKYDEKELDENVVCDALRFLYTSFRDNIFNNLENGWISIFNGEPQVCQAREYYARCAENLAKFIWGSERGTEIGNQLFELDGHHKNLNYWKYYLCDHLDQPEWVLSMNDSMPEFEEFRQLLQDMRITNDVNRTHYNPFAKVPTSTIYGDEAPEELEMTSYAFEPVYDEDWKVISYNIIPKETYTYQLNYQTVKDLFILDCMMEHYGEPTYTWIDKNNKNENGTAKAEWYTNLFNRMQQGYKKLESGLADSQDWMQYAFESGLVHMIQVNHRDEWESTMYSNCSNITENQVDIAISIAETKYNREMAKIQAKDKQYDMELKNIDTEHESLKQEYESIKNVINKNIERNFKMYLEG